MRQSELLAQVLARFEEDRRELVRIRETLIEQAGILREHVRRSEANERAVEVMRAELQEQQKANREAQDALEERLSGLAEESVTWAKLGKLLAAATTAVGLATGAVKLFGGP